MQKGSFPWYDYGWLEEDVQDSEGGSEAWFWVDGSLYERYMAALPLAKTPILWHGSSKHFKSQQYPVTGTGRVKQRASEQQGLKEGGRSGVMRCSEDTQMESQDSGDWVKGRACEAGGSKSGQKKPQILSWQSV